MNTTLQPVPVAEVVSTQRALGWELETVGETFVSFVNVTKVNHVLHGILSFIIPFYFIIWIVLAANNRNNDRRVQFQVKDGYAWVPQEVA